MDQLNQYREIVKKTILKYAQFCPSHGQIELHPVFDDQRDHYALMQIGWDRGKRIRGNLIYVTLNQGKVSIEYDGMERGITQELINLGIPREDIILAFQSPEIRNAQELMV
jgi:hypothetical protein